MSIEIHSDTRIEFDAGYIEIRKESQVCELSRHKFEWEKDDLADCIAACEAAIERIKINAQQNEEAEA